MRKIILMIVVMFAFVAFANAQSVYSATGDTLQGAETVTLGVVVSTSSSGTLAIQALCTELGGTSDGTLRLQGSVDGTSYNFITSIDGKFDFYPNDTLTITDGAVIQCLITNSPFNYYRWSGSGTSGDTTLITPIYSPKLK